MNFDLILGVPAVPNSENHTKTGKTTQSVTFKTEQSRQLHEKISQARKGAGLEVESKPASHLTGHARAVRLGTEFIAAIIVGTGIGYFADMALGTSPWLMLVMVLVGFAAGVLNVVRSANEMNASVKITPDMDLGPDVDEDDDGLKN